VFTMERRSKNRYKNPHEIYEFTNLPRNLQIQKHFSHFCRAFQIIYEEAVETNERLRSVNQEIEELNQKLRPTE
jgi:hypothetical protein